MIRGPGIRHLLGARGDGTTIAEPPNLDEHPDWQHVFIQSKGGDRLLTPGTKYLFCKLKHTAIKLSSIM